MRRSANTRSARARASTRSSGWPGSLRLTEGVPGEKIFPSNKYREERTHECRQKSPNDQLRRELSSGAFAFSPRFQRIFQSCRAISPLDSPLLQEFLSLLLSLSLFLVKYSKLHRAVVHRASLIVARDIAVITRDRG